MSNRLVRSALPFCVCVSLVTVTRAQSFNVDVGSATGNPVPQSTFSAGGGQQGLWTIAPVTNGVPTVLTDIQGNVTTVTATCSGGTNYANIANLGGASVNDLNLMSDIHDPSGQPRTWTFTKSDELVSQ